MAVAFADFTLAVDSVGQSVRFNLASPGSEPHGASQLFDTAQLAQFINHAMVSCRIELAGIGFSQSANVASEFNAGSLHSQANSEVGNFVLAGVADGLQHTFDTALAETSRNEDAVI